MPPRAATVGRAVTGLATMSAVRRNAGADRAGGCRFHSNKSTQLRRRASRGRQFSIRTNWNPEGGHAM